MGGIAFGNQYGRAVKTYMRENNPLLEIPCFGVMRILQEKLAPGDYLPVIILTAHADPATRKKALDSGARDFVSKPFDARDLIKRMRKQLDARAQHNRTFKAQRPAARR